MTRCSRRIGGDEVSSKVGNTEVVIWCRGEPTPLASLTGGVHLLANNHKAVNCILVSEVP